MKGVRGPRIPGKRVEKPKKGKGTYSRKKGKAIEVSIPKDKWGSLGTVDLPLEN